MFRGPDGTEYRVQTGPPAGKTAAAKTADVAGVSASYATENSIQGFVYRMYNVALEREPEEEGFNFWVGKLDSGEMKAADLVNQFLGSDEYKRKGKTNAQIVTDCYHVMLNREPEAGGFDYWKQCLDVGMTYMSVCAGFVRSPEFTALAERYGIAPGTITVTNVCDLNYDRTAFVYRMYQKCLDRLPDREGLEYWCGRLVNGTTGTALASGFVFSDEMNWKHLDNGDFLEVMYNAIMGRAPDQEGFNYWKNKLDYTNTREYVLNGFMFSPEFQNMCTAAGISVGNAIDTPDDGDDWQINTTILDIVNTARRENGIPDLTTREDLWRNVSLVRAEEISRRQSLYRPSEQNYRYWSSILEDIGYDNDYLDAYECYCYGYDEPMTYWFSQYSLQNEILSPEYEVMTAAFWPENYWQMLLFYEY